MRHLPIVLTLALCASARDTVLGVFRPELDTKVEVAQLLAVNNMPDIQRTEIRVKASPDSEFELDFKCVDDSKEVTLTENQAWIGCCLPDLKLMGSETTGFDCCDEDENLNGCSDGRRHGCCAAGSIYNGTTCVVIDYNNPNPCSGPPISKCPEGRIKVNGHCVQPCPDGQELVGNACLDECDSCAVRIEDDCYIPPCPRGKIRGADCKCVEVDEDPCPPGTIPSGDGRTCVAQCPGKVVDPVLNICVCPPGTEESATGCVVKKQACTSGVQAGKCYTFTFEKGYRFGYNSESGFYTASDESAVQQFGKFQFCVDEDCTADVDIDPGRGFTIQDIQDQPNGGTGPGPKHWLDGARDGKPITRTPYWGNAGIFLITKWPGEKYCLTSFGAGVGPTYFDEVGATITSDVQSCIPITLLEVPCDLRARQNNGIWGCNKTQASTSASTDKPIAVNASMNIDGAGVSGCS